MDTVLLIKILAEAIKQFIVATGIIGMKIDRRHKRGLLWVGYVIVISVLYNKYNKFEYIFKSTTYFLFFILIFDNRFGKKIEAFILSYLLVDYLDVFIFELHWLTNGIKIWNSKLMIQLWYNNVVGIFGWIVIAFIIRKKRDKIRDFFEGINFVIYIKCLVLITMVIFLTSGNMIYSYIKVTRKGAVILSSLNLFMTVLIIFIIAHLVKISYQNRLLEEEKKVEKEILKVQQEYYEKLLQKDEGMRRFRHDINYHMKMLDRLYLNKDIEKLGAYIKGISENYVENTYIRTDSMIADYFINEVVDQYKEGDFTYSIVGKFPKSIGISDSDLCIMIANMMKNVSEALEKIEGHKELIVSIKHYKENLFINVINSSVDKGENILMTSKKNRKEHGIGTKQIEQIAKKYHGMVEWKYEDGKFYTNIMLILHSEQEINA